MRSIRIAAASALALVLALAMYTPAAAQATKPANVAGKWELTSETPRGTSTMTLTLAQDGATVTGTVTMRRGDVPIKDAKLDGNNLSFTVEFGGGQRTFEMQYKATVDGDNMKGTISGGRGERDFTGKRVK